MPTIKYPKNPNVDTAFVEQDDGTQNRALMIAPQDISTLELPNNPNSTKGYITVDGQKQRVILTADITGGGGGSSLPDQTGHSGEFLTTDGTDASWAAVDALPSQTGNSGKFLTTDGTDASWSDKPLVNQASGNESLAIQGVTSRTRSIAIGYSVNGDESVGIGIYADIRAAQSVAIGKDTRIEGTGGVAIGYGARTTGAHATQIGFTSGYTTNSDANTFKVANANGNYEMMSADGTIPHARLTNALVSASVTISVADWNGGTTVSKTVSGLTATSVVWVAPDHASQSDYTSAGVYASSQTTDTLEFSCTTTPTNALTVTVVFC